MVAGLTLVCPVRGRLKAKARSKDGLSPTEEKYRVEAIKYLVAAGYPKENIRVESVLKKFGNSGRNSFRADLVVLDKPVNQVSTSDLDQLLEHVLILGEVKRDSADAADAQSYQVRPMLDFATRDDCVALYWDDVQQRVYWIVRRAGRRTVHEGPLSDLPGYGHKPGAKQLTFETIDPDKPLLQVFERIEDVLHSASIGPSKRFSTMMQLLLAKLYDENQHQATPSKPLTLQDFAALEVPPSNAVDAVNSVLKSAVSYYQRFLPEPVADQLALTGPTVLEVMRILAPIKINSMKQSVIQDFYMYFAKQIYKWDLAQYFTPTTLTEFIVDILNPRFGQYVMDPACGSADFLTAAFRRGSRQWADHASSIGGADVSPEAVQVAVLNMILNGDGKSNIQCEDSLAKIQANSETCDIVVCNPPFGKRIVEKRKEVLANFDLGHVWLHVGDAWIKTSSVMESQESGILFAEVCVKLLRPGGRLALVVPNGYLGNRSSKYHMLRDWLLRHCKLSVLVALPRFTFKGSGADVSASVLFCEKRGIPLDRADESEDYEFAVEIIDRVGWTTGDKRGTPTYKQDLSDGTFELDENDQLILDSDFPGILASIRNSDAVEFYGWLSDGVEVDEKVDPIGWTVPVSQITSESYLTLDPKRYSRKFAEVHKAIIGRAYFKIGDVVEYLDERKNSDGQRVRMSADKVYRYVEISDAETGTYRWTQRPGWDLPDRARHFAEPGDIYVGGIWNSVRKWFMTGADASGAVVTNGMHRMRMRPGCEEKLLDLVVGLCSEAYGVQMRALARGSDGLAEISREDAASVVLPLIEDAKARAEIQPFVNQLLQGFTSVEAKVSSMLADKRLPLPIPPVRPDHTSIV